MPRFRGEDLRNRRGFWNTWIVRSGPNTLKVVLTPRAKTNDPIDKLNIRIGKDHQTDATPDSTRQTRHLQHELVPTIVLPSSPRRLQTWSRSFVPTWIPELVRRHQVAVTRLLAEIRELGYTGSANLLVRYLNQGRADAERTPPSPRRLVSWLMTKPENLPAHHHSHLRDLLASCPHLAVLAQRVAEFAGLLTGRRGEDLDAWMTAVDADDLPALHGFVHSLRMDLPAVVAGLTLPYSNGPIEGANTKVILWNQSRQVRRLVRDYGVSCRFSACDR